MAEVSNIETVYSALKALSLLRATVSDVFKHLSISGSPLFGLSDSDQQENKEYQYGDLKAISNNLNARMRELETACTLLHSSSSSLSLGNTPLVAQDPNYDKTSLYPDMIISYRWLDNVQEYSCFAFQTLQNNFTKRSSSLKSRQRNRTFHNNHNISPSSIDYFMSTTIQRSFSDLSVEVVRPFGIFSILKIALDRTLRAVIVLRGFVIEWVLVKGFDETFDELNANNLNKTEKIHPSMYLSSIAHDSFNSKLDIWSSSRYQIFRTITEHANAAILHFYAPNQMDSAIRAYMNWLKSFSNLFSVKCKRCDTRLLNNMPPTWREFRTNESFHFECRP